VEAGSLDLGKWTPGAPAVELSGEWRFMPARLLAPEEAWAGAGLRSVPDLWEGAEAGGKAGQGCGSYRLDVALPPGQAGLGLRVPTVATAAAVYANGVLVWQAGRPAEREEEARAAYNPQVARLPASSDGSLVLLVQVSNHEYRAGGLWRAPILGSYEALSAARQLRVNIAVALAAALLAMAIHSTILFAHRRKERSYLFFALFAALVALRALVTGEYPIVSYLPELDFGLLIRLEYASSYLAFPLAIILFTSLFREESSRRLDLGLLLPFVPFVLLLFLAPLPVLTRSLFWFYPIACLTILVAALRIFGPALRRRRSGSLPLLFGGLLVAAASVNDIFFNSFRLPTGNLAPLAVAIFVFLQDLVLARRFTAAFDAVEGLSAELGEANEHLRREIDGHREARASLEALLAEKETHLQEIHHRVKNNLQLVSSLAALQAHRSEEPAAVAALAALGDRIRSIGLVHEQLYRSGSAEAVDFGGYAGKLIAQLADGFSNGAEGRLRLDLEEGLFPMSLDLCVDLGLILTELVTNAFKYAGHSGEVRVSARKRDGSFVLSVEDSGPGFPPGIDLENLPSLGFRVVTSLSRKRGGVLSFSSGPGARVELCLALESFG
jgi:two-component sensor histidine kinase